MRLDAPPLDQYRTGCKDKHDHLGQIVADEWESRGIHVLQNVEYDDPHFKGEIDQLGFYRDAVLINETKSNNHECSRLKALNQLARAYTHMRTYAGADKVFTTYTSTDHKDRPHHIWIPRKDIPNKYQRQLPDRVVSEL